jgi:hypothetical protein
MTRGALAALGLLVATPGAADALTVLTVGKSAVFRHGGAASAVVRVGRDPALARPADVTCGGGATLTLQLAAYPTARARVDAAPAVALPCDRWRRVRGGFVYRAADAAPGGVRLVVYRTSGFEARFGGAAYRPMAGPVGWVECWIGVGAERLLARVHDFRRNDDRLVATRPQSRAAAAGERAFWDVLHGVDDSATRQATALRLLTAATRHDARDGRAAFLLAMLHLYRFGQATTRFDAVPPAARADLAAATRAFARAEPLLWRPGRGDSRVPGFAAAAEYALGVVDRDASLRAAGLAHLDAAIAVNGFFNVFDLIPVAQATAPTDPLFADVVRRFDAYLGAQDTLQCPFTQPEICADQGLAPRNTVGALLLFGDVYAKGAALDPADVAKAETWYTLAQGLDRPGYRFESALAARVGHAAERAALYADADPANDPPFIGAGREACAMCHAE